MLAIIGVIVTLLASSALIGYLNTALNLYTQGFFLMFIIPVGMMLVGALAVSGLFIGQKISKSTIKTYFTPIAIVVGLLSFFTTSYVDYHFAKVNFEQDIKTYLDKVDFDDYAEIEAIRTEVFGLQAPEYDENGELISGSDTYIEISEETMRAYYDAVLEAYTYVEYLKVVHGEMTISFSTRGRQVGEINNPVVSTIAFCLMILGGGIGAYMTVAYAVGDRIKSKKHREYYDLKYKAILPLDKFEEIKKSMDAKDAKFGKNFGVLISSNPSDKSLEGQDNATLRVLKLRSSGEGKLILEKLEVVANKKSKTNSSIETVERDLSVQETNEIMASVLLIDPVERF